MPRFGAQKTIMFHALLEHISKVSGLSTRKWICLLFCVKLAEKEKIDTRHENSDEGLSVGRRGGIKK